MGISIHWENEDKTVVRYGFIKSWSWNDLYAALDLAERLSQRDDRRVDVIIDVRNADPMPSNITLNLNVMNRAKLFANRADSMPNLVIILGANSFIKAMYDTFRDVHAKRTPNVHFVPTLDQAHSMLSERQMLDGFLDAETSAVQ